MIPTWPNTVYMAPTWPHIIVYMILSTCSCDTYTVSAPYLVQPMDIALFLPVLIEKHTTHTNESLLVFVPVISIYSCCFWLSPSCQLSWPADSWAQKPSCSWSSVVEKPHVVSLCSNKKRLLLPLSVSTVSQSGLSQVTRSKHTEGRTVCSHLKPFSGQTV